MFSTGTVPDKMSVDESSPDMKRGGKMPPKSEADRPDWSDGLRQLYDSVLDEPLPAAFRDLLSKLDDKS